MKDRLIPDQKQKYRKWYKITKLKILLDISGTRRHPKMVPEELVDKINININKHSGSAIAAIESIHFD